MQPFRDNRVACVFLMSIFDIESVRFGVNELFNLLGYAFEWLYIFEIFVCIFLLLFVRNSKEYNDGNYANILAVGEKAIKSMN